MRRLIVICALATLATSCASIDTATGVRQVAKDIDAARAERLDAGSKYEFEAALCTWSMPYNCRDVASMKWRKVTLPRLSRRWSKQRAVGNQLEVAKSCGG